MERTGVSSHRAVDSVYSSIRAESEKVAEEEAHRPPIRVRVRVRSQKKKHIDLN